MWKKVKVRREGVFELAGVACDRDGLLMLVVGVREGRALRYAGRVSFGVTRRVVADLYRLGSPLADGSTRLGRRSRPWTFYREECRYR